MAGRGSGVSQSTVGMSRIGNETSDGAALPGHLRSTRGALRRGQPKTSIVPPVIGRTPVAGCKARRIGRIAPGTNAYHPIFFRTRASGPLARKRRILFRILVEAPFRNIAGHIHSSERTSTCRVAMLGGSCTGSVISNVERFGIKISPHR